MSTLGITDPRGNLKIMRDFLENHGCCICLSENVGNEKPTNLQIRKKINRQLAAWPGCTKTPSGEHIYGRINASHKLEVNHCDTLTNQPQLKMPPNHRDCHATIATHCVGPPAKIATQPLRPTATHPQLKLPPEHYDPLRPTPS